MKKIIRKTFLVLGSFVLGIFCLFTFASIVGHYINKQYSDMDFNYD